MKRRDFIRNATMGLAGAAIWTQLPESLFASPYGKPIGLQLYTLRDQLEKDAPGTIKQLAAIGYKNVEIYSLYGKTSAEFGRILKDNGITASSGHYLLPAVKSEWNQRIEDAKTLGLRYMVIAILPPEERKSLDDYKKLADLFNKAGEATMPYDYLLKTLDPKLVAFEMDCFWVTHAGQDPVAYFKEHPGRFPLLHIKDMKDKPAPTQELDAKMGLFAPVGSGSIDWKRIFAAAKVGGMEHYYVEQDYCEIPPLEAVKMSYQYLDGLKV